MLQSTLRNNFTSGELYAEVQDRVDIAPVAAGIQLGQNLVVQVTGGLKKRRGFWWLGAGLSSANLGRLIPFRKSQSDALMLEFGNFLAKAWLANGAPLMSGGAPVTFATPYASAQLAALRYKQVADVIYFFDATGATAPQILERISDTSWAFNTAEFLNGPWEPENADQAFSITVSGGTYQTDANPTGYGAVATTAGPVNLVASKALFTPAMVGSQIRLRQSTGNPSMRSWFAGYYIPVGWFIESVGNIYVCTATAGSAQQASMSTPPVQSVPGQLQNDGCNTFEYLSDGAGILTITAVTDSEHATASVNATLPLGNGQSTTAWATSAYGGSNGWPQCWPSAVEERLVMGATAENPDFIDLTRTAGFTPTSIDCHPGQGTGNVISTDALRARLGDDGSQVLWTFHSTFTIAGSTSGEYVISGGLFGDPLTPTSATYRQISSFGSADVGPVKLEKGIAYVTTGGQSLRGLTVDLQQNLQGMDLSFLAHHIEARGFDQLCWIKAPDRMLWARLGDGGFAALTMYDEQEVRGWTSQALAVPEAGAVTIEDLVSIPGPGGFETLWMLASGTIGGAFTRFLAMLSQKSDALFMDFASLYAGAAVNEITGLGYLAGETARCLANGVQIADQVVSGGGTIAVPAGTTAAKVGLAYQVNFESLKVNEALLGGTLGQRQSIVGCMVDLYGVTAQCGLLGAAIQEQATSRGWAQMAAPVPGRFIWRATFAGDPGNDPRVQITEDSAYDFGIFGLRPTVNADAYPRG